MLKASRIVLALALALPTVAHSAPAFAANEKPLAMRGTAKDWAVAERAKLARARAAVMSSLARQRTEPRVRDRVDADLRVAVEAITSAIGRAAQDGQVVNGELLQLRMLKDRIVEELTKSYGPIAPWGAFAY